jgi:hypothetical protein
MASHAECEALVTNVGKAFKIAGTAIKDEAGYAKPIEPAAKAGIADSASQLDAITQRVGGDHGPNHEP